MADAASAREGDLLDDLLERERSIVRIARLEGALREALARWGAFAVGGDMDKDRARIAELRKLITP